MSWKNPYNGPNIRDFDSDDRESWHKNGGDWRREPDTGESWTSTSWRNNMEMHRYHGDPSLASIQPNIRHYEMMEERPRFYGESSDYHRHYAEPRRWPREERHREYERRDEWKRSVNRDQRGERSDRRRERVEPRPEPRRERDDRKSERDDRRHEGDERKNENEEKKDSETVEEEVQEKTETATEPSTVDEAEQAEIPQQQEAPDEGDNYSEGIKSAADLVILKPNFDDVHFYGANRGRGGIRGGGPPRGRGGYRGSFPRGGIDEKSPSWVSQYFDRVQKSKSLLPPPPQRFPPPGPSSSHFHPEDHFPRGGPPRAHDMPNFGGGMREVPKTKTDFFESSASRRMKEWERFKSENGDDPHQFIETLSDVDEKETWYQILDLVGGPTGDDDKKMPIMPPMQAPEPPKRGLLGAHPAKGRFRTPSPDRPSFFRHAVPSIRPGLYTGKDGAMGASRSAPSSASVPPRRGLLGQGPGKSNSMRNYERGRPSFNPYTDALPERYGGEKSLNGPIQLEGPAYEPNLPSQSELLERNSLLEAQLRALKSMQEEREMRSGHLQSPHQLDGSNEANYDRSYIPDRPPSH